MKVFITGGTGFIGTAVINELQSNGHQIIGLARSEKAAAKLSEQGVTPLMGSLTDLDQLAQGAKEGDSRCLWGPSSPPILLPIVS